MIRYYFEIDDKYLKNWPHKYLTAQGVIDSSGYHNLSSNLSAAAYSSSEYVIESRLPDSYNGEYYTYIKSRGPKRILTDEHITFIKLASIEI